MLPELDDNGYLPPGIHRATLDEIAARFGQGSEIRRVQTESLRWLMDLTARAGIVRVILDGSYVTDSIEPNDVDCVLLQGPDYPKDHEAHAELERGLPFLDLEIVQQDTFLLFVSDTFATDRDMLPKGLIEVVS